jgi:hypothetical protein
VSIDLEDPARARAARETSRKSARQNSAGESGEIESSPVAVDVVGG